MLNQLRRDHPAMQWMTNVTFHEVDSPDVLAWSKKTGGDVVLGVLNLDPHGAREATVRLDLPALGLDWDDQLLVHDQVTGLEWTWGQANYVRLDPFDEPAHLFTVKKAHPVTEGSWT
jgi:starch synthase (maltosyl-transferring)